MSECWCIVRHAITPRERVQASEALSYARSIGDPIGIMLALMQLAGECPARLQQKEGDRDATSWP